MKTQGWLKDIYVHSSAIPGDTTFDVLLRFDAVVGYYGYDWDWIGFAIGINDTCHMGKQQFYENMRVLVDKAKYSGANVFLVGLTRVMEPLAHPYENQRIALFDRLLEKVAEESGAEFVEIYKDFDEQEFLSADGLHPNDKGHEFIANRVVSTIFNKNL